MTSVLVRGQLIVAGLGIKLFSHITHETKLVIQDADKVFYLSHHPLMDVYIKQLNPRSESLNSHYDRYSDRSDVYQAMANEIVSTVVDGQHKVCTVFYGHPCIFVAPGRMAFHQLSNQGYICKTLPAVSTEDCIFADLMIDGAIGYVSYEATDVVLHNRKLDIHAYIFLWQPKLFGNLKSPSQTLAHDNIFKELVEYLLSFYDSQHKVLVYEAAMFPGNQFVCRSIKLGDLKLNDLSWESTIIIPPAKPLVINPVFAKKII